jgi:hypothetical protein
MPAERVRVGSVGDSDPPDGCTVGASAFQQGCFGCSGVDFDGACVTSGSFRVLRGPGLICSSCDIGGVLVAPG